MQTNNSTNILEVAYQRRGKLERAAFVRAVCAKCDWTSEGIFFRKRKGITRLTNLEIEAIRKLDKQKD